MHRLSLTARVVAGALAFGALSAPAGAQLMGAGPTTPAGPRIGILVGLSSATLSDVADGFSTDLGIGVPQTKRRNGVVAGLSLTVPVASSPFAFRPELLYAQKGVRTTSSYYPPSVQNLPSVPQTLSGTSKLDYLELPLLLELEIPPAAGVRPALYAGPSVAYLVRCRSEATYAGTTESAACDADGETGPRKFDVGGVAGGQLGFDLGGQRVAIGARYTLGFTNVSRELNTKNRAFAVYGTVEFPFGR